MEIFKQLRFWLVAWGVIGIAALLYLMIAASVQPSNDDAPSALDRDRELWVGEMADFEYAFSKRLT